MSHKQAKSVPKLKVTSNVPHFKNHKAFWVNNNSHSEEQSDVVPSEKPKMELVQQYAMVRGKL